MSESGRILLIGPEEWRNEISKLFSELGIVDVIQEDPEAATKLSEFEFDSIFLNAEIPFASIADALREARTFVLAPYCVWTNALSQDRSQPPELIELHSEQVPLAFLHSIVRTDEIRRARTRILQAVTRLLTKLRPDESVESRLNKHLGGLKDIYEELLETAVELEFDKTADLNSSAFDALDTIWFVRQGESALQYPSKGRRRQEPVLVQGNEHIYMGLMLLLLEMSDEFNLDVSPGNPKSIATMRDLSPEFLERFLEQHAEDLQMVLRQYDAELKPNKTQITLSAVTVDASRR